MSMLAPNYPWYSFVEGDELEQGDIIEKCPVFAPPADLQPEKAEMAEFKWEERDLIVMSQTCDLVKGREKLEEVLFCPVHLRSEMGFKPSELESARKGGFPGYHIISECVLPGLQREVRIVEFRRVYTLPLPFVRARATQMKRLRLMPPYREHLSQSFARFFMRVGLPVDIPSFTSKPTA